jgi:hypothetical protein
VLGVWIKSLRFEQKKVTSAVDRAEQRVLTRFGAFVRQRAKTSIRKRKKVSEPGQPPSSHTGLLRRTIFFAYEPRPGHVLVGPVLLQKNTNAPRLLERGGSAVRRRDGKRVRMTYRPRPFMGPAFEREKPQLPKLWRNSVR